ncbi:MAG: HK97 family phage prohead protease [Phenylobacterium sp.]|uniref:HK97 family phage prohead protease n=1 Tax=Phenylobacterium sp. TaxID=1871053 RepID=UPI001A53E75B|nr:HK97 family phage prohead protease [Phenylobacterium sp.]MBL8773356.1 HK97 family phage prohead protease [Phenylobacterium sp.]
MTDRVFIRGFAAPFGLPARIAEGGAQVEMIEAYAFNLAGPIDIRCLHDGEAFADTKAGTLRLDQNDHGLRFEAALPGRCEVWAWARDLAEDRLGVSVQFAAGTRKATRTRDHGGQPMDLVTSARISHIAIVHEPAYRDTSCWLSTWDHYDMPPRLRSWAELWGEDPPVAAAPIAPVVDAVRKVAGPTVEQHLGTLRRLRLKFDPESRDRLAQYVDAHRGDADFATAMDINIQELAAAAAAK